MTAKRIKEPAIFRVQERSSDFSLGKGSVVGERGRLSLQGVERERIRSPWRTFHLGKYYRKIIRGVGSLIIRKMFVNYSQGFAYTSIAQYQDRQHSSPSLNAWLIY